MKVTFQSEGKKREKLLSYNLQVLGKSAEYFKFAKYREGKASGMAVTGLTNRGRKLKNVYIPQRYKGINVTAIRENAFQNDAAMERVYISDHVKYLDYYDNDYHMPWINCFQGCINLREIHLGKKLENFGTVENLPKLERITVAKENRHFQVRDNVLFSGESTLVCYPAAKKDVSYVIPEEVTEIKGGAFGWAEKLEKVSLPKSIKNIQNAFPHSGLKEILIPEGVENFSAAFESCNNLERAELPMLSDGENWEARKICGAFKNCGKLKTVLIKSKPNRFAGDNFSGCRSLEEFQLAPEAKGLTVKDGVLFDSEMQNLLLYPAGKKTGNYVLPSGIKKIAESAFEGAQYLSQITADSELLRIGSNAFADAKITEVLLNPDLEEIGYHAFKNTNLKTIHIPKKVKKIYIPFAVGCSSLSAITVDKDNNSFSAENGILYDKQKTTLIAYPGNKNEKKFSLPKSVIKIGREAFSGNRFLQEISMTDTVTVCEPDAFSGAAALRKIRLSKNLKQLGERAFSGCGKLQKITIPDKVQKIGDRLFDGCTAIKSITLGKGVKRLGVSAFRNCKTLRKLTLRTKTWKRNFIPNKSFVKTGGKNYRKLVVQVPKTWYRHRKTMKKMFYRAGLSRKAKIRFAK